MKLLLRGGRVVDPANGRDGEFDVLVEDGRIARVGKGIPADGADVLEIRRGWIVSPGHQQQGRGHRRATMKRRLNGNSVRPSTLCR